MKTLLILFFTTYVASSDVQKQRKVRLLPELCQTDALWAVCIAYHYTTGRVYTARWRLIKDTFNSSLLTQH